MSKTNKLNFSRDFFFYLVHHLSPFVTQRRCLIWRTKIGMLFLLKENCMHKRNDNLTIIEKEKKKYRNKV